jgi:hypothetical protein
LKLDFPEAKQFLSRREEQMMVGRIKERKLESKNMKVKQMGISLTNMGLKHGGDFKIGGEERRKLIRKELPVVSQLMIKASY